MRCATGEAQEPLGPNFNRHTKLEFHGARITSDGRLGRLLMTPCKKLVKVGARIVRHGRYVAFQLAEVAVPLALFAEIIRRIGRLRPRPPPFSA